MNRLNPQRTASAYWTLRAAIFGSALAAALALPSICGQLLERLSSDKVTPRAPDPAITKIATETTVLQAWLDLYKRVSALAASLSTSNQEAADSETAANIRAARAEADLDRWLTSQRSPDTEQLAENPEYKPLADRYMREKAALWEAILSQRALSDAETKTSELQREIRKRSLQGASDQETLAQCEKRLSEIGSLARRDDPERSLTALQHAERSMREKLRAVRTGR